MKKAFFLVVFAAAAATAQSVEVVLATYGGGEQLADVTETVRTRVKEGRLPIPVTPQELRVTDPAPGTVKSLRVVYKVNGNLREARAKDFESLAIEGVQPAPATVAPPPSGGFFGPPEPAPTPAAPAPRPAEPVTYTPPRDVSLKREVSNGACFYRESDFRGDLFCVETGKAEPHLGAFRRAIRSVRLVGNARSIWLFDFDNFAGATARLQQSTPDLRLARGPFYTIDFEDKTASVRVE